MGVRSLQLGASVLVLLETVKGSDLHWFPGAALPVQMLSGSGTRSGHHQGGLVLVWLSDIHRV